MTDIRAIFSDQATACVSLGSPFMGRLMGLFSDRLTEDNLVAQHLFNWPGDPAIHKDNAPLRLAGALHALKLKGRALEDVYPPNAVSDDVLWDALQRTISDHEIWVMAWLANPPQTNEVRRAAALLPTLALLNHRYNMPVELLELGASGGLNLCADYFQLETPNGTIGPSESGVRLSPEWRGVPPAQMDLPLVTRRAGVDLNPLDPDKPEDRLRLLSYLWADQPQRLARTKAAIEIANHCPVEMTAGDAGDWLTHQLARPSQGRLRVVFHTVAWQYFPEATSLSAKAAMKAHKAPLVQISLEADGGKGAALTLTSYPVGTVESLGRLDFHGRWIEWRPQS